MLGSRTWLGRKKHSAMLKDEMITEDAYDGEVKTACPPGLDTLIRSSPRPAGPCPPPSPAPRAYRWLRSWWSETRCPGWWSSRKHAPSPSWPAACHWLRGGPWRKKEKRSARQNHVCVVSLSTSSRSLTSSEFLHQRTNGAGGRTGFCWTWAYFSGIRNRWHVSWTHDNGSLTENTACFTFRALVWRVGSHKTFDV